MSHLGTTKRPMPSAWSAHIYGPVRGMKPTLWQQWREVAAHFRIRDWLTGAGVTLFTFAAGIATAVVLNFATGG